MRIGITTVITFSTVSSFTLNEPKDEISFTLKITPKNSSKPLSSTMVEEIIAKSLMTVDNNVNCIELTVTLIL
mgnify:CR=1 FL=1